MKYEYTYEMREKKSSNSRKIGRVCKLTYETEHEGICFPKGMTIGLVHPLFDKSKFTVKSCEFCVELETMDVALDPVHVSPDEYNETLEELEVSGWRLWDTSKLGEKP